MTAKPRRTTPKAKPAPKDDLTRPAKFSLEALLANRVNLVKSTRVTVDPDVAAHIQELRDEKDRLQAADAQIEGLTKSNRRMAQKDDRAERIRAIDAEVAELLPTLDGTWVEVQFRPLTQLEQDDVNQARSDALAKKETFGPARVCATMWATQAQVRPDGSEDEDDWATMSVDEWLRFIEAIGIPQFQALDRISGGLNYGRVVTPDFFEPSSRSQPTASS